MKRIRRRKCSHCQELFHPDHRNRRHQRHCSKADCRKASKQASQRRWLGKPKNRDYFQGPTQIERVRAWRKAHPGYWRRKRTCALQDVLLAQPAEKTGESGSLNSGPLQDVFNDYPLIILGLIAQISASALQDDIAFTARQLLRLGADIVGGKLVGGNTMGGKGNAETTHMPRESARSSPSVQLGRSAIGP